MQQDMDVRIWEQETISVGRTSGPGEIEDGQDCSKDSVISVGTQSQTAVSLEGERRAKRQRRTTTPR